MFSQGFSNSTMEIKRALVFWKLKHHCTNTLYYKISQNSTMVENIAPWYHGAIWALRENCISYVHALICLGWLWNCYVVNQKASFLCTLCIYIYLYIVTVWYLAKCMTKRHFIRLNIFIFILYANFIYCLCLKKSWLPLLDQPEKKWPPSFNCQFLMIPYLFAPPSPLLGDK